MMPEREAEDERESGSQLLAHDTVRFLLSMERIPKRIRDRFGWLWGSTKTLSLSNLNRDDVNQLLEAYNFDALITMSEVVNDLPISSSPSFPKKNKKAMLILQWLNDLKQAVKLNLLRSTGGADRERRLLATRYAETHGRYEEHTPPPRRGLFGLRKG